MATEPGNVSALAEQAEEEATDKTGTLTENRMTVTQVALDGETISISGEGLEPQGQFIGERESERIEPTEHERLRRLLEVGVLCNNAEVHEAQEDVETLCSNLKRGKANLRRSTESLMN